MSEEDISFEFSIFPQNITFAPTHPNGISHFQVYLQNPQSTDQQIQLLLEGDRHFSINSNSLTIKPGIVHSLVVSFHPTSTGIFNSRLICSYGEKQTKTVDITGECIESPLMISDFKDFVFSQSQTDLTINIANRSLIKTLHVLFETDCTALSVVPATLDFPPFSSSSINIHYDSTKLLEHQPQLHVQCEESSDSIIYPLPIAQPLTECYIDFGSTTPGHPLQKVLHIDVPEETQPPEPFTLEYTDDGVILHFIEETVGMYSRHFEIGDYLLTLVAEVVEFPLDMTATPTKFSLRNKSSSPQRCAVSISPDFTEIEQIELDGNGESAIQSNSVFVRWDHDGSMIEDEVAVEPPPIIFSSPKVKFCKEGKQTFDITNTTNSPMRLTLQTDSSEFNCDEFQSIFLRPHDSQSVSVSFLPISPQKATGSLSISDVNGSTLGTLPLVGTIPLTAHERIIPFFQLDGFTAQQFDIKITGAPDITATVPDWVSVSNKFTLSCKEPPTAVSVDTALFEANGRSIGVPIIAYRGCSMIRHKSASFGDDGIGTVEVENVGTRRGFVIFTSPDTGISDIKVCPPFAILKPNESKIFQFSCPTSRVVLMHSGDEILREIRAAIEPASFYGFSPSTREINAIDTSLIPKKAFKKLFAQYTEMEEIELDNDQDAPFVLLEKKVDFGEMKKGELRQRTVLIENETNEVMALNIAASSKDVQVKNIAIKPHSRTGINIEVRGRNPGEKSAVVVVNGLKTIHLKWRVAGLSEVEKIDFGKCQVGRRRRAQIRLTNHRKVDCVFSVRADYPLTLPQNEVTIPAEGSVLFNVHANPQEEGEFESAIEFIQGGEVYMKVTCWGEGILART